MKLNNDYWHSLDKAATFCHTTHSNVNEMAGEIGISHGMGDLVQGFKSKIFAGASHVELGFTGKGKGYLGQGSTTPETFGSKQREDIRQLKKVNDVTISVHATPGFTGVAGFTQKGFSDEERENNIFEIKKAVEFAADTAEGGPVVFHVGEYVRPISEYKEFQYYPGEAKEKIYPLVDKRTGQIFKVVREDEEIWVPNPKIGPDGKPIVKVIKDSRGKEHKSPVYEYDPITKEIRGEAYKFTEYFKQKQQENPDLTKEQAAVHFYKETVNAEIEHAKGQADEYELVYKDALEDKEKITKALQGFEELYKRVDPSELWRLKEKIQQKYQFIPPEEKDPIAYLKDKLVEVDKRLAYGREVAVSSRRNAERLDKDLRNIDNMHGYAIDKTADSIARSAIHAYDIEKQKGLKEPIYISPENLMPEWGYGNHPEELKNIVLESRKKMVDLLTKPEITLADGSKERNYSYRPGVTEAQAEHLAGQHIKATFDVAHAYLWKKFFKGDPSKSPDENRKDFDKWILDQAKELQRAGVLGHLHISDNFGYHDEHLSPGQGQVPVGEFIRELKSEGYKGKIIAEIGGQPQGKEHEVMTEAWAHASDLYAPIYRTDIIARSWADIGGGYFGRTQSPGFLVGEATPNQQDWVFYSQVPLE
ncbi:MAG: sugar phosphate isomerase/epimerase [Candidatus Woesearchaeota archaeon]|nr:MAG: sugar phosphate isomerase/epimerase [Candidatus Woesearchaeota archaeon]